jgi:hypothetical protein
MSWIKRGTPIVVKLWQGSTPIPWYKYAISAKDDLTRLKASATTATTATYHGSSGGYMGGTIPIETPPATTRPELGVAEVAVL